MDYVFLLSFGLAGVGFFYMASQNICYRDGRLIRKLVIFLLMLGVAGSALITSLLWHIVIKGTDITVVLGQPYFLLSVLPLAFVIWIGQVILGELMWVLT